MISKNTSRVGVTIVGSGHTRFGRLDDMSVEDLVVDASREALASSGLPAEEIDAIFLGHFNSGLVPDGFASSLVHQADEALRFTPAIRCENACASGAAAIMSGIRAIQAGAAKNVFVVGVEKMTSRSTPEVTTALGGAGYQHNPEEASLSFPQVFARAAEAYGAAYGDPSLAMAMIAQKNHRNALANPLAHMQREMSLEFCNTVSDKNPLIADPLRMTDCSLITDGAAALVLTAEDKADGFAKRARFRAAEQVSDFLPMSRRDFLAFEGPRLAMARAFEAAGVGVDDIDFAEVHDCFTIAELMIYEAMGLAPAGRGIDALSSGAVYRGGKLPVNLSGGLKAKGHPVGATGVSMHALAYRQLTGSAGDMQIEDANLGLVFNMGGSAVANYVSILESC
ncbi:MAG: acetyl-CoA acetyltransferase [Hyphomicrobiales bacterium]|nr:MAG: acetyl-CoA acetyltransferase [Hyphomicrobiales bacterium]